MSSTVSTKPVRLIGLISMIAGVVLIIAGATVWTMVRSQLLEENITVAEDAEMFGGKTVDGPLDAYFQADIINQHALHSSEGKTYAELDKEDPVRATMMNASFLRSSLFTSVIAFGVSAFAGGMGVMFLLIGYALRSLVPAGAAITRKDAAAATV
ncbi:MULTISPECIES: aromatic ring-opening dioxygenase LigA [unclassified Actinotalea]|uniref:aromatic ring-opening dioxygenase LigA n=1 Tax=unclassified Actinotalea TaxID=2638618 RepID=UPI0015F76E25|nr:MULTISPECIES: aromatic ring-opening dioxygenase LigA [unclassified Actinotalea]